MVQRKQKSAVWSKLSIELLKMEIGTIFSDAEMGAKLGLEAIQVSKVVHQRAKDGFISVDVIAMGHIWRWKGFVDKDVDSALDTLFEHAEVNPLPPVAAEPLLPEFGSRIEAPAKNPFVDPWTVVKELKDGSILLEDAEGELWKAARLG